MTIYNAKPWIEDLVFTKGDTINKQLHIQKWNDITEVWEDFDMTDMQVDMDVCKCDGTLIRSFTSAGISPEIIVSTINLTIYDSPFTKAGKFKYDIQITDDSDVFTIMKGNLFVQAETTT